MVSKECIRRIILILIILFIAGVFSLISTYALSDEKTVTVYLTVSKDNEFVTGVDGTVVAHVPFTVSYFDLGTIGLEKYYRYENEPFEMGGHYISGSDVIEEPTLLHCFIEALGRYYTGRSLTSSDMHSDAINVSGPAEALFMTQFWGHNYNLMYFVNYEYPLMAPGIGSTCDYILLNDNDEINVAMFSEGSFRMSGAFCAFDQSEANVGCGDKLRLALSGVPMYESTEGQTVPPEIMKNEMIRISSDYGHTWKETGVKTDNNGEFTLQFDSAGTYYVSAGPEFNTFKHVAPPICVVTVRRDPAEEEAEKLEKAKQTAITDLQNYKSPELYREAEQIELASIVKTGIDAINAADDMTGVQTAYADAESRIDALKTNAQYEAEEQGQGGEQDDPSAKFLAEAKQNAITELQSYRSPDLYREAEQIELASIVKTGIDAINAAIDMTGVQTAYGDAVSKIDALKTKAQYEAEEQGQGGEQDDPAAKALAEAKNNAKIELDLYMAPSEYRDAERASLLQLLTEGKEAIDKAETEDAVKALLIEYKSRIDQLKTDAEYAAEEEAARQEEERKKKEQEEEQRAAEEKRKADILAAMIKSAKEAKPKVTTKALKKHKAKISWKKVALSYKAAGETGKLNVTGYKIYRATKKAGKYKLIKTIKKAGTLKYTDKKLKKGKKYFYKVRTYTKINGETYLGKWSAVKKIRGR